MKTLINNEGGITGREIIRAGVIFLAMNVIFFSSFIFFPSLMPYFEHSDAIRQFLAWKQFMLSSLNETGEIPLWFPYAWSGSCFVGDIQAQLFYPLNAPSYFIRAELYLTYYMLLHVFLSGLFMYCFTRLVGLPKLCAFIASIFYMYGGFTAGLYHYQAINLVVCWIPALFLALEMLVRKRSLTWAFFSGLVMAIFFLGGHPQLFYYSSLAAGAYFIFRIFSERIAVPKLLALGAVAFLFYIGISAITLFPALEAAKFSPRAGGISLYHSAYQSLPLKEVSLFFLPRFMGGSFTCHEGFVAFFLAIAAIVGPQNRKKTFFIVVALFSLLFSVGKFSPLYIVLFKIVPGLNLFRVPSRMLAIFGFSIPILCGFGLNDLIDAFKVPTVRERFQSSLRNFLICMIIVAILTTVMFFLGRPILLALAQSLYEFQDHSLPFSAHKEQVVSLLSDLRDSLITLLSMSIVSALIIVFLLKVRFKRTVILPATFTVLALVETWSFSLPTLKSIDPAILYAKNKLVEFLKNDNDVFRVLNMGGERILPQYLAVPYGIELADGYNPTMTEMYLKYTNSIGNLSWIGATTKLPLTDLQIDRIKRPELLGLLNVKYLLSETNVNDPGFRVIREFYDVPVYKQGEGIVRIPRVIVYEHDYYMPRAFLVPQKIKCVGEEECLNLLDKVDLRKTLVVDEGEETSDGAMGNVEIVKRAPNHIELEVVVDKPSSLFLSETWYPGWVAFDNGRRVEVKRGDYLFRYVPLSAGQHKITMRYCPTTYRLGKWISAITLAAALGCLVCLRKRNY